MPHKLKNRYQIIPLTQTYLAVVLVYTAARVISWYHLDCSFLLKQHLAINGLLFTAILIRIVFHLFLETVSHTILT